VPLFPAEEEEEEDIIILTIILTEFWTYRKVDI